VQSCRQTHLRVLTIFDFGRRRGEERRGEEGRGGEERVGRDPSSMESHDSPKEEKKDESVIVR